MFFLAKYDTMNLCNVTTCPSDQTWCRISLEIKYDTACLVETSLIPIISLNQIWYRMLYALTMLTCIYVNQIKYQSFFESSMILCIFWWLYTIWYSHAPPGPRSLYYDPIKLLGHLKRVKIRKNCFDFRIQFTPTCTQLNLEEAVGPSDLALT